MIKNPWSLLAIALSPLLLCNCARLIEADLPPESAYRKTLAVKIKPKGNVIPVERLAADADGKVPGSISTGVARVMDIATLHQAGRPKREKTRYAHVHRSFRFAMASSNAYKHSFYKNNQFRITGWKRVARFDNRLGSAADIYEVIGKKEVVIAFRGTENATAKDWLYGNLNVLYPGQYNEANYLYKLIRHRYGGDTKIITTGHSLGAGLALYCARSFPDVDAVVFDASPKVMSFSRYPSSQMHVVEKGEILSYVRAVYRYIPPNTFNPLITHYVDYFDGSIIEQHSMYHLAFAILKHSARLGNKDAIALLKDNPIHPKQ